MGSLSEKNVDLIWNSIALAFFIFAVGFAFGFCTAGVS